MALQLLRCVLRWWLSELTLEAGAGRYTSGGSGDEAPVGGQVSRWVPATFGLQLGII